MEQLERNKNILRKYIPEASVDIVAEWIYTFDFKLKIKKSRASKYGDYRQPINGLNHQITINYDLNPYAFLVTLIHEIAHLTTYLHHKNNVKPHGEEWKYEYKKLMRPFMNETVFPQDIIVALEVAMQNPAASGCSDVDLLRALRKYDLGKKSQHLEDLPANTLFSISDGRQFIKGERIRTRYRCMENNTNRIYLFNPLSEVFVEQSQE